MSLILVYSSPALAGALIILQRIAHGSENAQVDSFLATYCWHPLPFKEL